MSSSNSPGRAAGSPRSPRPPLPPGRRPSRRSSVCSEESDTEKAMDISTPRKRSHGGGNPLKKKLRIETNPLAFDFTHKRRSTITAGLSSSAKNPTKVFIWDLDETLIVMQSLEGGGYTKRHGGDHDKCKSLHTFVVDEVVIPYTGFSTDIETVDPHHSMVCIRDIEQDLADTKLKDGTKTHKESMAELRRLYESGDVLEKVGRGMSFETMWTEAIDGIEKITNGWLSAAQRMMEVATSIENSIHVIVSNGHILASVVKLLLFDFHKFFDIDSIYSSRVTSKMSVFQRLRGKYPNAQMYAIGDGPEEETAARMIKIPFRRVEQRSDIDDIAESLSEEVFMGVYEGFSIDQIQPCTPSTKGAGADSEPGCEIISNT